MKRRRSTFALFDSIRAEHPDWTTTQVRLEVHRTAEARAKEMRK